MLGELRDRPELRPGLKYGAIAWVSGVGLLLVLILVASGQRILLLQQYPVSYASLFWSGLHGWGGLLGGSPPLLVMSVVPASLLVGMGYLAARAMVDSTASGFRRGAWITAGYLPLVVLGLVWTLVRFGLASREGLGALLSVNLLGLLLPIAFAGILFPAIFGGIGGRLYQWRAGGSPATGSH
jgi:hypothetical protein